MACCVLCRVNSTAGKAGNSSVPSSTQQAAGQAVDIIPQNGTFGSTKVAGVAGPTVTIANLFANRVSC